MSWIAQMGGGMSWMARMGGGSDGWWDVLIFFLSSGWDVLDSSDGWWDVLDGSDGWGDVLDGSDGWGAWMARMGGTGGAGGSGGTAGFSSEKILVFLSIYLFYSKFFCTFVGIINTNKNTKTVLLTA